MIIDDDEDILNLFHDFLIKEGYDVVTFLEPLKALKEIQDNPTLYSLVITDIRMPGISGIELVKRISTVNENLKVILMSAFEVNGDSLRELPCSEHLQKPIRMKTLAKTIRQILGIA